MMCKNCHRWFESKEEKLFCPICWKAFQLGRKSVIDY